MATILTRPQCVKCVIPKCVLVIIFRAISSVISFRWMVRVRTDDKSPLVQVMAWCHQAASHCLSPYWSSQCRPRPQLSREGKYRDLETLWGRRYYNYITFIPPLVVLWNSLFSCLHSQLGYSAGVCQVFEVCGLWSTHAPVCRSIV